VPRSLPCWLLAGVIALAACGKKDTPPAPAPASAPQASAPAVVAPPPASVTLSSVTLGKAVDAAKKINAATDLFAPRDTVHASVETHGVGPATLGVRWTRGSDGQDRTVAEEVITIAPAATTTTTEFRLARPEGLAAGDYRADIVLDGKVVATRTFKVQPPQAAPPVAARPKPAASPPAGDVPPASSEQLGAASLVHYGEYECELGQTMTLAKSSRHEGYVDLSAGRRRATLTPVLSTTGAVRLEEVHRGALLVVQIPSKSILFDQKAGQRLIDGCQHARQK
jgi:hypothetical protein